MTLWVWLVQRRLQGRRDLWEAAKSNRWTRFGTRNLRWSEVGTLGLGHPADMRSRPGSAGPAWICASGGSMAVTVRWTPGLGRPYLLGSGFEVASGGGSWHPKGMRKQLNSAPKPQFPELLERFLRYVRVDTQSDPAGKTTPSTPGQWTLLRMLERELRAMGAKQVTLGRAGHLMATVPGTAKGSRLPAVAFLAHVDTATDFCASGVRPLVHARWDGRPIRLPDDPSQVLDCKRDPELRRVIGHDLITASGKTLLGADDKAGVAIIMSLADHLLRHRETRHGPVRVAFVPDEEIGLRGAANLDLDRLAAKVAYTLDGHGVGEVVGECFSGDSATVTVLGVATHPGEARKHRMVNAVHLAGKLLAALPREFTSPETTEMYEGYLHPLGIEGNAAAVKLQFILRDFTDAGLADKRRRLAGLCRGMAATEPRAKIRCEFRPSYRNMAGALRRDRRPVDLALVAMREVGLDPHGLPIRGATDGTRLSERGLPTPNLSCGEHNPHGPLEWVTVQDLEVCTRACVELVRLWAEKGAGYRGYRFRRVSRGRSGKRGSV